MNKTYLTLLLMVFLTTLLCAQEEQLQKDLVTETRRDTISQEVRRDSLFYNADSLFYFAAEEKIKLMGQATVKYKYSDLKADTIIVDLKNKQASTRGNSFLQDKDQIAIGKEIFYDMETEWGLVNLGASKFDKGFYYGNEIRKVGPKAFDVDKGFFTTCDAKNPHFYIMANKLRLYQNDMVVGKPVIFYVNHFPIFALPFAAFSIKRGRETGILVPSPGYNSTDGKYVENLAFYYAYKNYADATLAFDYYEKTGWEVSWETRYIKRYLLNGNFLMRFRKTTPNPQTSTNDWLVKLNHHHEIGYNSTLDADLSFISSKRIWEGSENIDERLSEQITSRLAFRTPLWGSYLNVNNNYTEDLNEETKSITLPSISYALPSKPIYELFSGDNRNQDSWWKGFSYSYNFKALHTGYITDPGANFWDVLYKNKKNPDDEYINQHNAGIKHATGLRFNYNWMGWLKLSQTFNYNEAWFDRDKNGNELVRGSDYNTTSSASFSLYGVKRFANFPITAVRHIISPRLSFSYHPDFGQNEKYYSFGGIGLSSAKRSRRVSFNLGNKWQLKLRTTEDETKKLNDFFSASSSISYDFEKEGKRFSDINHSLNMNLGDLDYSIFKLTFRPYGSIKQIPYDFKVNSWKNWDFPIEDWNIRINSKLNISGDANYAEYFPLPENEFTSNNKFFNTQADTLDTEEEMELETIEDIENLKISSKNWTINISHDLRTDKTMYKKGDFYNNIRTSLNAKITQNWTISYDNYIDIEENELRSYSITLNRDMHCWKLYFRYTKQGSYWNYQFKFFNIKLPDSLLFRNSDHK
ncbi:MAG: putative LPS assembly protein LptD [Candidatus Cloacimonadota bacterium]|nr:putative LPS assembly protein LptD [Candidatus Cloacimonadota bacterium]